jgi:hypothetical protein
MNLIYSSLLALLLLQLLFSSVATAIVVWRQKEQAGIVLLGLCHWAKSGLIAAAIVWGPTNHHWRIVYVMLAALTYAIGDVGQLLMIGQRS